MWVVAIKKCTEAKCLP